MTVIIESESFNKSFRGHDALRGISLSVPEGSIYALLGANGAGKTTTIKTLLNILTPTSGTVTVMGVDSRRLSTAEFSKIGYVSENQELPQRLTVGAYLDYLRPFYPTWDRSLERSLVSELQLPTDRKIRDLSHGMRMKASLACALSYRPKLLVLDEPFSGLDPLVRDELMEKLLQQADEMTVFLSSHELDEIEGSTTFVGYLENGRLLFQESMAQLSDRFRDIRLTVDANPGIPKGLPESWINTSETGNVISFVDTRYDPETFHAVVDAHYKGVRQVDVQPVALRSIFTSLARSSRSRGRSS